VIGQFISESVILALVSLGFAFCIFLLLRGLFFSIDQRLQNLFSLNVSSGLVIDFVGLAIGVGLVAGFFCPHFFIPR